MNKLTRAIILIAVAVLIVLAVSPLARKAWGQDGIDAGLFIDGKLYRLLPENCMIVRNFGVPWGAPQTGYALQLGTATQPQSGRVYVQLGGVVVVLPEIHCVDRLFTNGFEP